MAQGNVGALWRFDLDTATATAVDTGDADLTNAAGLVLRRHRLIVICNVSRVIATLRLDRHADSARLVREVATDPEQIAQPPDEVVSLRLNGRSPRP